MKDLSYLIKMLVALGVMLLLSVAVNLIQWRVARNGVEVSRSERSDTVWMERKVTEPEVSVEIELPAVKVRPSGRNRLEPLSGIGVEVSDSDTLVSVPMEQRVYEDSTYRAYVSGYNVSLDSLVMKEREVTRTILEVREKKPPDVSVGIVAGYGYGISSRQMEPFIGVGVTYRVDILKLFGKK